MARTYKVGFFRALINRLVTRSVGRNKGDERVHLLTTVGRKSGEPRTTPVTIVVVDGKRWLVAPYGAVGWVHNLRASGQAKLSRGTVTEDIRVVEVSGEEAAPVLAHYLQTVAIVRPYFDVNHDSPMAEIAGEAQRHPVFRIT